MVELCNNESIITYYYIGCFHYNKLLPIITIITYYYVFETGQLAAAFGPLLRDDVERIFFQAVQSRSPLVGFLGLWISEKMPICIFCVAFIKFRCSQSVGNEFH